MNKSSTFVPTEQNAATLLSGKGLKKTPPRLSILTLLLSAELPLSHLDIASSLPEINTVTIYRVLAKLHACGIAHRIETTDHQWHFAVCPCGHTIHCHPHFSCRRCGRIECLSDIRLPVWNSKKTGYIIEDQEVYLHGLCGRCSKKESREAA
jgi:Fur family transcriptional regulator, ferric uptake regulator